MPVPQKNLLFVEQASCLFLRIVQDVRFFQMHSTLLTIIFDDRRLGDKPWEIQRDRPLFSRAQILIEKFL
ncbi:hypothetical protein [Microcoleus vaginatus]|uniref:hypothetical protein n=1 Tax=Microcoleus vaginatus TaxID=119532 RepID=UPI0016851B8F|nr:hypothetical protein [Microcoleus sp. FACHB-84]MBD2009177.1 hypothetical protein [Microcoleus sp. FACHB-45]